MKTKRRSVIHNGLEEFLENTAGRPKPGTCEVCQDASHQPIIFDANNGKFRGWICVFCKFIIETTSLSELKAVAASKKSEVDAVIANLEAMEKNDSGTS